MSIWKYQNYLNPKVEKQFRLTLKEGDTPCDGCKALAEFLKIEKVYIKREDKNPTGSFKDRSLAFQLSIHFQKGEKEFVVSSSGNAAISAISYCKLFPCTLHVFVSKKIPADKLERLLNASKIRDFDHTLLRESEEIETVSKDNITIYFSNKPSSESIKFLSTSSAVHLRGSNDDLAPVGFKTIAYELAKQAKDADAILIPCSSGTSTIGIYHGFFEVIGIPPQMHIIQTTKIHQIAKEFDKNFKGSETSLASAISDRVAFRKEQVVEAVTRSGGSGWVISDDEILTSQHLFSKYCNITVSFDGALSLAGLIKALTKRSNIKRPILILSGK